jgi:uncharacterized membrane protein YiaA
MDATRPSAGTLLAKYLIGLLLLVVGLALALVGVFNSAHNLTLVGLVIAAIGIALIVAKIVARNRPTHSG